MYCSAVASSLTVAEVLSPLAVKLMMDGLKQLFPFIWHTSTVRSPASDGSKVPLNDGAATSGGRKKKCAFPVPCAPSAMIDVGRPPAGAGVVISAGPPQAMTRTRAATTQNAMDFIRTPHDRRVGRRRLQHRSCHRPGRRRRQRSLCVDRNRVDL